MEKLPGNESDSSITLRWALQANAIFSGISALIFIFGSRPVSEFLGSVPPAVLTAVGLALAVFAITLFWTASQHPIDSRLVRTAIALDLMWVLGSILLLLTDRVVFSPAGKWSVAIVADLVALFGALQYYGLRRVGYRRQKTA